MMKIRMLALDIDGTLMDAQKHPDKYNNLAVRVSGFSAYFRSLMKSTQDEIIARTEYAAM